MGWSESYYRDYMIQARREWKERVSVFLEEADRFFEELPEAEATCRLRKGEVEECRRLWDELGKRLRRDFLD